MLPSWGHSACSPWAPTWCQALCSFQECSGKWDKALPLKAHSLEGEMVAPWQSLEAGTKPWEGRERAVSCWVLESFLEEVQSDIHPKASGPQMWASGTDQTWLNPITGCLAEDIGKPRLALGHLHIICIDLHMWWHSLVSYAFKLQVICLSLKALIFFFPQGWAGSISPPCPYNARLCWVCQARCKAVDLGFRYMLFWLSEYFVIFKGSMTAWCKRECWACVPHVQMGKLKQRVIKVRRPTSSLPMLEARPWVGVKSLDFWFPVERAFGG